MKYVKMLLVLVFGAIIGVMYYQDFTPSERPEELPSKKVVAHVQSSFDSCMAKPEITTEMNENSLELLVAHANLMNSVEYVAEHRPTDKDLKILKHREEIFRQVEHKVHSRNDELTKACSLERQLPEELAAN